MTSRMCGAAYTRPNIDVLHCTFLAGHHESIGHSWEQLRRADQAQRRDVPAKEDIDVLIGNIAEGLCDEYLEAILAAGHGRKRAIRGVKRPYGVTDLRQENC